MNKNFTQHLKHFVFIFTMAAFCIPYALASDTNDLSSMACDKDELFRLMVQKGHINLQDTKMCFDFNDFPNIKINLEESNYNLNGTKKEQQGNTQQDTAVANIAKLFNQVLSDGKSMHVSTRGYADGTRNISSDRDNLIFKELFTDGGMTYSKLKQKMQLIDPTGFAAIVDYIKTKNSAYDSDSFAKITQEQFLADERLSSMLRNFYLAKARGENICQIIHADPSLCDNQGEISASLDRGLSCFDGCCDGRRGAVVKITLPQATGQSQQATGKWQPPFDSPSRQFQGKMQLAASLSLFDMLQNPNTNTKIDSEVEKAITTGEINSLDDKKLQKLVEKDRKVFKDLMSESGCAGNDYAIDHARKIYWETKKHFPFASDEIKKAVTSADFEGLLSLYEKSLNKQISNPSDVLILRVLFSGAGQNIHAKPPKGCGALRILDKGQNSFLSFFKDNLKDYKSCELISDDAFFENITKNDSNEPIKTVYELLNSNSIKDEKYSVVAATEGYSRGRFWIYDQTTGQKHAFSYDYNKCNQKSLIGMPPIKRKDQLFWGNPQDKDRKRYDQECFSSAVTSAPKYLTSKFYPDANPIGNVTPTEPLNCLNVARAYEHELKDRSDGESIDLSLQAQSMQKPFCQVAKDGQLKLHHDPHSMQRVAGVHGFVCKACGSGVFYDEREKKISYRSRTGRSSEGDAFETWFESAKAQSGKGLTLGSAKHLRTYLIPNCGTSCADACACLREGNIQQKINAQETEVFDFSQAPLAKDKIPSYQGDKKGSFACLFTPPVPHTCSFNPYGESSESQDGQEAQEAICPLKELLLSQPDKASAPTQREIENYKQKCSYSSFPMPEGLCEQASNNLCQAIKNQYNCIEADKSPTKQNQVINQ